MEGNEARRGEYRSAVILSCVVRKSLASKVTLSKSLKKESAVGPLSHGFAVRGFSYPRSTTVQTY